METRLTGVSQEVIISDKRTFLIGERINPTGKKKMAAALASGDYELVRQEARDQVAAGADILDVNVGAGGVDEVAVLPRVVEVVQTEVDVPLCLDSGNPFALEATLKVYKGKPLVNSVKGEGPSLAKILPLVKEYGTAVIALPIDEGGIPKTADGRLKVADKIIGRAAQIGIPIEDIIVDCLALTMGADDQAGLVALETARRLKEQYGVNITAGASNISFGLPSREVLNQIFLGIAIAYGMNVPVVNVAKVRHTVMSADLIRGTDKYARRYIKYCREHADKF